MGNKTNAKAAAPPRVNTRSKTNGVVQTAPKPLPAAKSRGRVAKAPTPAEKAAALAAKLNAKPAASTDSGGSTRSRAPAPTEPAPNAPAGPPQQQLPQPQPQPQPQPRAPAAEKGKAKVDFGADDTDLNVIDLREEVCNPVAYPVSEPRGRASRVAVRFSLWTRRHRQFVYSKRGHGSVISIIFWPRGRVSVHHRAQFPAKTLVRARRLSAHRPVLSQPVGSPLLLRGLRPTHSAAARRRARDQRACSHLHFGFPANPPPLAGSGLALPTRSPVRSQSALYPPIGAPHSSACMCWPHRRTRWSSPSRPRPTRPRPPASCGGRSLPSSAAAPGAGAPLRLRTSTRATSPRCGPFGSADSAPRLLSGFSARRRNGNGCFSPFAPHPH